MLGHSGKGGITTIHLSLLRLGFTGYRGVARIFQRRGNTLSNIILMAVSPRNIVGCLLKKGLQGGGGHGHPRIPQLRPWVTKYGVTFHEHECIEINFRNELCIFKEGYNGVNFQTVKKVTVKLQKRRLLTIIFISR